MNAAYRLGGYDPKLVQYIRTSEKQKIFGFSLLLLLPMVTSFVAAYFAAYEEEKLEMREIDKNPAVDGVVYIKGVGI